MRITLSLYRHGVFLRAVSIIRFNESFNYRRPATSGQGSRRVSILLFLNNDIEVIDPGWLEELSALGSATRRGCRRDETSLPGRVSPARRRGIQQYPEP